MKVNSSNAQDVFEGIKVTSANSRNSMTYLAVLIARLLHVFFLRKIMSDEDVNWVIFGG